MAPILFKKDGSPPCRAVMLTAKALELELDYKEINMTEGEHLQSEFTEINPQHTIPLLDDDGFVLVDSHAIVTYLVGKYGSDDSLYPADLQIRALIDSKFFYNCGTLQTVMRQIIIPIFHKGVTTIPEECVDKVNEAYGILENALGDREWLVGDSMTLADLCIIPIVNTLNVLIAIDADTFPKLTEYLSRFEESPYYETEKAGLDDFKSHYEIFMA